MNTPNDPASWSSKRLAAQLVFTGVTMTDRAAIEHAAALGVGGITLFGDGSPTLQEDLAAASALAPSGTALWIAADEEGGAVQRLASLIDPLPSAQVMGTWTPPEITAAAAEYGARMRRLGVRVDLGPVADLAVPGHYIAELHRAFSSDPKVVATDVKAWMAGMRRAGVLSVVKHWPGHGQATDSHTGPATTPPWAVLESRDLYPFEAAFAAHAPAVMVGHLDVPGLTAAGQPASESPAAIRYLRQQAGPNALIITDDLSMAAASTSLGITPATAAVRSLAAGADVALACWTPVDGVVDAVSQAIDSGVISRAQADQSARRILAARDSLTTAATGPAA